MRVVLDTNVLVSATLIRGGNEDRILRAWRQGGFDLIFPAATLGELARVLSYPKLRNMRWLTAGEVTALLEILTAQSVLVPGELKVKVCRDPEDDKFVAAGIEGGARYLVTGDKDLLVLQNHDDLRIVTPAAFLVILRGMKPTLS
jgi:putative PIN family toxin of toxin-antitoxin system